MQIEVDDRERDMLLYLYELDYTGEIKQQRLQIGDYALFSNGLQVLIERKTWDDLASSLKDGRLERQIANMANLPLLKVIIVEGVMHQEHCHVESSTLRKKIIHLMFQGFHIIYSRDKRDTAEHIVNLANNIPLKKGEDVDLYKKPHMTEQMKLEQLFTQIPQIGLQTAKIIIEKKWSLLDLYCASVDDIATLKFGDMPIPLKKAEKIYKSMGLKSTWVKILESFNGITKTTAVNIMSMYNDPTQWTPDNLSNVHKTEKLKLSKSKAEEIILWIKKIIH